MQGVNERPLRQKVYVPVTVDFDEEGKMRPTDIYWLDGQTYHIDRVLKVRQAAAMRSGGHSLLSAAPLSIHMGSCTLRKGRVSFRNSFLSRRR